MHAIRQLSGLLAGAITQAVLTELVAQALALLLIGPCAPHLTG